MVRYLIGWLAAGMPCATWGFIMALRSQPLRLLIAGWVLCASVEVAQAAEAVKPTESTSLQKGVDQFNAQRERLLSDYQAQLDQLKGATEEQRQQILEKLQAQKKELDSLQREQGKQLREELRKLRQSTPAPRK